ncbi:MAG: ATP-binding protein [Proteobacteria bacterium]|nr:ATP-binding protein [Pseudomonadota bacterium]
MWIRRDFEDVIQELQSLPIKVLKGPRQVGKTALLHHLNLGQLISFDDAATRNFATSHPRTFLDQLTGPVILDEVTLVPDLFLELKRRVDEYRRDPKGKQAPTYWLTGSNQTLLQKHVRESLAGRAGYFDLNTLSIHELGSWQLEKFLFSGGWPELNIVNQLDPKRYINDLVATFIEKDIVSAAGIERKASFSKALGLLAGRVGQIVNASDIAKNVGVSVSTLQSWIEILEQNGIIRQLAPYYSNLNNRLIKSPKIYFEDVSLATRLQGWSEFQPLMVSPYFGSLCENIVVSEVVRFFINSGEPAQIFFLRSKEKVEVDLLIGLPNQSYIAAEVKFTAQGFTEPKVKLIDSLGLNIVAKWVITFSGSDSIFQNAKTIKIDNLWGELKRWCR